MREGSGLFSGVLSVLRDHFDYLQLAAVQDTQLDEHEQVVQLKGSPEVRLLDDDLLHIAVQELAKQLSIAESRRIVGDENLLDDLPLGQVFGLLLFKNLRPLQELLDLLVVVLLSIGIWFSWKRVWVSIIYVAESTK